MKITTFDPSIITKRPQAVIAAFETLGYTRSHNRVREDGVSFSAVRMKNPSGFHVDVIEAADAPIKQDLTVIRVNVDDFDAAVALFKSRGYTEPNGFSTGKTRNSRYVYLRSPSGFFMDICQNVR